MLPVERMKHCAKCGCFLKKVKSITKTYDYLLQCNNCHFLFDMDMDMVGSPIALFESHMVRQDATC